MHRSFALAAVTAATFTASYQINAAEPAPAIDLAAHQYFYVDFPCRLRALRDAQLLAEAELAVAYNRAARYEPFRRFDRYAATYMVDQTAQLEILAAAQRVRCLQKDEAALWRERQAAAANLTLAQ
jgi:hypothetical protein